MAHTIGLTRRGALRLAATGAGLTMAGCCCRSFQSPLITDAMPAAGAITPHLRPRAVASGPKPARFCLDAHTHFFNASDANIRDYFAHGVARESLPDDLMPFVQEMAAVLDDMSNLAPTAKVEYDLLREQATRPVAALGAKDALDQASEEHQQTLSNELLKQMRKRGLDKKFVALRATVAARAGNTALAEDATFDQDTILDTFDHGTRMAKHKRRYGALNRRDTRSDPGGVLEFVGYMLSYRFRIIRDYQKYYCGADSPMGIDGVFAAMVDFDYFLDCPTQSNRTDQVRLHSLLALMSGGWMLPIVPYNPWTDIERDGASLALVQTAIREYGFIGVKIYPATGFFPYGNATTKVTTVQRRPADLAALDDRLLAMFTWCAENGVPVMAHTDESMGADAVADDFGGPDAWTRLIDEMKHRGLPAPVVNLGHFGGGSPDKNHPGIDWTSAFVQLLGRPGAERAYVDLAYWTELCSCGTASTEAATALGRLLPALRKYPDRVMYGTDWFMTSTQQAWEVYGKDMWDQIATLSPGVAETPTFWNGLFWQNAVRCFGLGEQGAQRDRVQAYYAAVPGGLPEWFTAAGAVA